MKFCLSVRNSKLNFKKMKVIDINENIPGVKVYFVKIYKGLIEYTRNPL